MTLESSHIRSFMAQQSESGCFLSDQPEMVNGPGQEGLPGPGEASEAGRAEPRLAPDALVLCILLRAAPGRWKGAPATGQIGARPKVLEGSDSRGQRVQPKFADGSQALFVPSEPLKIFRWCQADT